jgi:hypothetical protein
MSGSLPATTIKYKISYYQDECNFAGTITNVFGDPNKLPETKVIVVRKCVAETYNVPGVYYVTTDQIEEGVTVMSVDGIMRIERNGTEKWIYHPSGIILRAGPFTHKGEKNFVVIGVEAEKGIYYLIAIDTSNRIIKKRAIPKVPSEIVFVTDTEVSAIFSETEKIKIHFQENNIRFDLK